MTGKLPGTMIADASVGATQLGTNSVAADEIAANAVGSSEIIDGSITAADLAPGALFATYESAEQTITANGTLSLTHGLGGKPRQVMASLVCQTAELGYSIGDEIVLLSQVGNALDTGFAVTITATTIDVKFGAAAASIRVINKSTGAIASITNANWRMVMRAIR